MDLSAAYKKLTNPFATNKNAHIHNKNIGKARNKETNKSKEANKSIKLKRWEISCILVIIFYWLNRLICYCRIVLIS